MMQLSSKNDDSSLCYDVIITIKFLKIDKFGDFSCDIDYNCRTDIFRDVISLLINQCDHMRPQSVRQPRIASKPIYKYILTIKTRLMCVYMLQSMCKISQFLN